MKYSRDPGRFYAAKLHSSLEKEDTDTAGRIILTSTTVCNLSLSISLHCLDSFLLLLGLVSG